MSKLGKWCAIVVSIFIAITNLPSCSGVSQVFKGPPNAPINLNGQADSYSQITIQWEDKSDNEDGFNIYRNGVLINSLPKNAQVFQDKNLQYGTQYSYVVTAFNDVGETNRDSPVEIKTLNPPIVITLNRIGVVKDHDPWPKGAGEIYMYLAISDGKSQPQTVRIPSSQTIALNDNESKDIPQQVFSTNSVGDELKFVAIAFESDSPMVGAAGKLLVQGLTAYLTVQYGQAGQLVGSLIKSQPSESDEGAPMELAESTSDDFVGAIEKTYTSSNNWGEGSYSDIRSGDLRLWFTISIAGKEVLPPQQPVAPSAPTNIVPPPTTSIPVAQPTITVTQPTPSKSQPFLISAYGFTPATTILGNNVSINISFSGGTTGTYYLDVYKDVSLGSDQKVNSFPISHNGISTNTNFSFLPSSAGKYHLGLEFNGATIWSQPNDSSRLSIQSSSSPLSVSSYRFSPGATTLGSSVTISFVLSGGSVGTYTLAVYKDISLASDQLITNYSINHDGISANNNFSFTPPSKGKYYLILIFNGATKWSQPNDSTRLSVN
jgi:hypothetical protein